MEEASSWEANDDQELEIRSKLSLLRSLLENQDPSSKEIDDSTLRRFLRARDLNTEKACGMVVKYLKWRRTKGCISPEQVPNEISQKKLFLQGSDKLGRPVLLLLGSRHFQNTIGGVEEFKRFIVYAFDKICSRLPPGQEQFIVIGDLQGWGYSNCDIRGYLAAISIVQDFYPERLGKMLIVNAPFLFMKAWNIVCPFIDKKTKDKIHFIAKKNTRLSLLEEIEESQLPEMYGGKLPLLPIQDI